jgi:MFS family permease
MFSRPVAAFLDRHGIHYGWIVALVTFLTMLATAGAVGAPGIMLKPLEDEFGWSNAEISQAFAIRLVLFGLMGPFSAALMNRYGVRSVVSTAIVLVAGGMTASLAMTALWQLVLFWGLVIGFGTGMTAQVLVATIATRWFVGRRGLVVGFLTASGATGQLVFLPALAALSETYGWRAALMLVLAMLLVVLVAVLALMADRPHELGAAPYGATEMVAPPPRTTGLGALLASPLVTLREVSGSHTFWVLFVTFYVCGLSTNGLIQTHWVSICGDYGVQPVGAAGLLAFIGVFDFVGTLLSGWLSDRYDNRWLLFFYYGLRGLSLIYLPFTEFNLYALSLFALFYGLDWVATVPPTVRLAAGRFGAEKAPMVYGWVFAGHQLGAATAAFGAGWSRTDLASYLPALYVAGAFCLAAAALVMTLDRPSARVITDSA